MACSIPKRLVEPGRYNFPQGAIYRLKLTNIPGHPGVELYPTLELALATPRTEAFLAHNFIPFELTDEDFEQVLSGNFVTKVIYLPDAEHQEAVLAGAETLVSTRLDPGKDPIVEAERRGSIMAIIRIGNKDLQAPGAEAAGDVVQTGFHGALGHGHGGVPLRRWRAAPVALNGGNGGVAECRRDLWPASPRRSTECRCAALRSDCRPAAHSAGSAGRLARTRRSRTTRTCRSPIRSRSSRST